VVEKGDSSSLKEEKSSFLETPVGGERFGDVENEERAILFKGENKFLSV